MNAGDSHFLPDRLRPRGPRKRPGRRLALLGVVPVMLLALPQLRVKEVRVTACPQLPAAAVRSLQEIEGRPALGIDLEAIRDEVEVWPGVGEVSVELQLPGTISVNAAASTICGSVRVGRSWHGVDSQGSLAGVIETPVPPVLRGFNDGAAERLRALGTARRLEDASRGRVREIQWVTPLDFRVVMTAGDNGEQKVVHVSPEGTPAEISWCAAVASGSMAAAWADLRCPDRMVIGEGR
ncbi:MAG: FtsQ-type POTRA domain-containing protein [Acidobacteriota bacterium]